MITKSNISSPKLITLNCSGGISLGAYMAGVFYELTKEAMKPEPKINIDIITGASAGAMSGVLAAHCLLTGATNKLSLDGVEDSPLYKAWVERSDIRDIDSFDAALSSFTDGIQATIESFQDSLQKTLDNYEKSSVPIKKTIFNLLKGLRIRENFKQKRTRKNLSLLSGEAIKGIASLVCEPPKITKTTKPLALLMTLTNLQGLLENVDLSTSSESTEQDIRVITNAETRQFLFHAKLDQATMNQMWDKAVIGSRASGAFPVAFPPIWDDSGITSANLEHLSNDYFQPNTQPKALKYKGLGAIRLDDSQLDFLYSDGGILDGLPLLKGIELETELRSHQNENNNSQKKEFQQEFIKQASASQGKRLHVYIRPIPVENLESDKRLTQGHFSMIQVGISGLTLPSGEYDFIRLKEIQKRNEMILAKQKLLDLVEEQGIGDFAQFKQVLEEAIPYQPIELCPITAAILGDIADADANKHPKLSRLKPIYAALPPHCQASLKEGNAASLLASDFLGAFGGFFNEDYRKHDFLIGRLCGITWLVKQCDADITEVEVRELVEKMKTELLDEDPKPSDLKFSQKLRIGRIILRALRIIVIESKIIGFSWIFTLGIVKLSVIFLLAIFEILATLLWMGSDLLERIPQALRGQRSRSEIRG